MQVANQKLKCKVNNKQYHTIDNENTHFLNIINLKLTAATTKIANGGLIFESSSLSEDELTNSLAGSSFLYSSLSIRR